MPSPITPRPASLAPKARANPVADKLREARALIERGWCQGQMFCGGSVCIRGALMKTYLAEEYEEELRADRLLHEATGFRGYLGDWNDAPGRTQADVLAAFDRAIQLAESEQ